MILFAGPDRAYLGTMRGNYVWLILITLLTVISLYMFNFNPEQAARIAEADRNAAFSGQARDLALMALVLGIGGFIAYLTFTRR